jgi:cell division protein FtsW
MSAAHAVKAGFQSDSRPVLQELSLLIPIIGLFGLSIVMVFSASMSASSMEQGPALSVLRQQGLLVLLAVTLMIAVSRIPLGLVEKAGPLLVVLSMLILAVILMPGVGTEVWGSVRWIKLGPLSLQPSEFAKVFLIIYIAGFLTRKREEMRIFSQGILIVSIVLALFGFLLLMEPDFGSTVVIVETVFGMMFVFGIG